MLSDSSTKLQLCSQQREMDQHQRDQDLVKTICIKSMLCYSHMTNNPLVAFEFIKYLFLPWQAENYSSLDFGRTLKKKLFYTQKVVQWIKEYFKKQTKNGKIEFFNQIMKLLDEISQNCAISDGGPMQPLLKPIGKQKQHAFSVFVMKDGKHRTSDEVVPLHGDKKNKNTLHSEEILIGQIEKFLQNNGTKVSNILIYTYNSPCLKRKEKDKEPCISLILNKAFQWFNEYKIVTHVIFTKFWGPAGKEFFAGLNTLKTNDFKENPCKSVQHVLEASSLSSERQKMTSDFNTAVAKLFLKRFESFLGSRGPLRLYHLKSEDILN